MKKALILTTALALTSSVAMADSFSFGARAQGSFRVGFGSPRPTVVIRDHREQPAPAPVYTSRVRWNDQRYLQEDVRPIPANLDCRNWDPALERDNACSAYSTGYTYAPQSFGAWSVLGTRESAVPDNQFITVRDGRSFSKLMLTAEQGNPVITKIAIRFMDEHVQVVPVNGRLRAGTTMKLFLEGRQINQIVVYTANGSHGTYSIAAL